MANEVLEITLTLDTGEVKKGFIALENDAKKAGGAAGSSLGDGFSKGQAGLVTLNSTFELVKTSIDAIKKASDLAFDFAKVGEEIAAIGTRFELLSNQAGLIPDKIRGGIESAVDGTVDMEDALKKASESIVELGGNAERLPQLFDLARRASAVFGGDTISRVDQLSASIASGNTRVLRSIGLQVDAAQVNKQYADSIGVSVGFLSREQQQQALLNAVLETGNQKFKDINSSITPLSTSSQKLTVSFKELGDTGASVFNTLFGTVIKQRIDDFTGSLDSLNVRLGQALLGQVPTAAQNVRLLTQEIRDLEKSQDLAFAHGDTDRVESINKEIAALRQKILIQNQISNQEATSRANASKPGGGATNAQLTFEQQETLRKLTLSGEQSLSGAIKANLELRRQDKGAFYADEKSVTEAFNQSVLSEQLRFQAEQNSIEEQYKTLKIQDNKLYNSIVEQSAINHAEKIKLINQQFVQDSQTAANGFAAPFISSFDRISASAQQVGASFKSGVVSAISTGIATISGNLARGKGLFDGFGKAILGIFGQMAQQIGSILIATGIGIDALWGLDGLAAIAAGIGLVAIGGVLSALSGGGDSSDAAQSSGGGITSTPSNTSNSAFAGQSAQEQKPQTIVNFNVQGDILDSQDTYRRMIDLFHDNFSSTGAQLPKGIVPT